MSFSFSQFVGLPPVRELIVMLAPDWVEQLLASERAAFKEWEPTAYFYISLLRSRGVSQKIGRRFKIHVAQRLLKKLLVTPPY